MSARNLQTQADAAGKRLQQLGQSGATATKQIEGGTKQATTAMQKFEAGTGLASAAIARYNRQIKEAAVSAINYGVAHKDALVKILETAFGAEKASGPIRKMSEVITSARLAQVAFEAVVSKNIVPLQFTLAGAAVSYMAQQMAKLTIERAKIIDQQAMFSASTGIAFEKVNQLDQISGTNNSSQGGLRKIFQSLQSQWADNQNGVQEALDKLGATGNVGDPKVLSQIAEGFQKIGDPVEQSKLAIQLFGSEGSRALETLNLQFIHSANDVDQFGTKIDAISRTQIHQFKQDMNNLELQLKEMFGFHFFNEDGIKAWTAQVTAAFWDVLKQADAALDRFLSEHGIPFDLRHPTAGATPIPGPPPVVPGAGRSVDQGIIADQMLAEAQAAQQRQQQTLDGQRAIATAAEARAKSALDSLAADQRLRQSDPHAPGLLSPEQRLSLSLQQKSASDIAVATNRYVKSVEDAAKSAAEQAKAQEKAKSAIEGYEKRIREKDATPVERMYMERSDLGFAPGSSYGQRATAATNTEAAQYLDKEQDKINKEITDNFAKSTARNVSRQPESERVGIEFSQNATEVDKQLDAILKTHAESVVRALRAKVVPLQQIALVGHEQQSQSELAADTERRLKLQASYDSQRIHTYQQEVSYQRELSALESDELQIKLRDAEQKLTDAGSDLVKQAQAQLEIDKARQSVEDQRLQSLVREAQLHAQNPFADGSLKSGLDEFIREANAKAEEPGKILYDGLNHAVDGFSDSLTKAMDGQKADWGKMFMSVGQDMQRAAIKSATQQGIGWVGKKLGMDLGQKKDGQSAESALWVQLATDRGNRLGRMLGQTPNLPQPKTFPVPGIPSGKSGGGIGGTLVFGGSQGGGIFSLAGSSPVIPGFAEGGLPTPEHAYMVGENGPEMRIDRSPGSQIIPMDRMSGGGGIKIDTIDARGADFGVINRIDRAIDMANAQSVNQAAHNNYELSRRRPQSSAVE